MCSCRFLPPCWMKTVWSTPASCERAQVRAQLVGRADAAGAAAEHSVPSCVAHASGTAFQMLVRPGRVLAEDVVVAERELEEAEAVEAAAAAPRRRPRGRRSR